MQESKLRVDSREALLTGGKSGPALRPGQPDESLMIRAIRHQAKPKMPPIGGKLPAKEIDDLAAWVKMGAPGLGRSSTPAATLSSAPLKGI